MRKLLALLVVLTTAAPAAEAAEARFPTKPIRLIIPFAAGASADIVVRLMGPRLTENFGQPVVVDNRAGAGGVLGAEIVAKAAPDGYTLLIGSPGPLTINPLLLRKIPYRSPQDFAPVTLVSSVPMILLVNPSLPAKSVKELIALARAKSGGLNYASAGNGSVPHLAGELFKLLARVDAVHVPYKGSGPALTELIAGQVAFFFDNIASGLPYAKSNRLRALAVTSPRRLEIAAELPTMIEAGMPGYEAASWNGVVAPAGTPIAVIDRIHAEFVKALRVPEIREKIMGLGAEIVANSPREFSDFISREMQKWGKVAKAGNIRLD
ncbi:MAG: tripartite tricarboxylate transporter substrate binding protein [Betaproteobacteria bacterium]|nr:tripartite tricarboxylate transporter substrate binding protein [Betaproteobacteria bacterium]